MPTRKKRRKRRRSGPKQTFLSEEVRRIAKRILETQFRIIGILGVNVFFNKDKKSKNKFSIRQSADKICILVVPKERFNDNSIHQTINLWDYPAFADAGITSASAAKLAFIAVNGWITEGYDCEHRCHHHHCINPKHHHFVPRADNIKRKAHQKKSHELRSRNSGGQFKPKKSKTSVVAECNHGRGCTKCIHNIGYNKSVDWKDPDKKSKFKELVQEHLPDFKMAPFWWRQKHKNFTVIFNLLYILIRIYNFTQTSLTTTTYYKLTESPKRSGSCG